MNYDCLKAIYLGYFETITPRFFVCQAYKINMTEISNPAPKNENNAEANAKKSCFLPVIPEKIANQLGKAIKRVVLIANNPAITEDLLSSVIEPSDLLVFFNNASLIPSCIDRKNPLLVVFRAAGDSGNHWGLPPNPSKVSDLNAIAEEGLLSVMYSKNLPDISALPPKLQSVFLNPEASSLFPEKHTAWTDYPVNPENPYAGPSSGFALYRIFLYSMRTGSFAETTEQKPPMFNIALLGFNNTPTSNLLKCHNWDFERSDIEKPSADVKLIPVLDGIKPQIQPFISTNQSFVDCIIDCIKRCTYSQSSGRISLSFQMSLIFSDAPISEWFYGDETTGEFIKLPVVKLESFYFGLRHPAIPWGNLSRFRITTQFGLAKPPENPTIIAVVGNQHRVVASLSPDIDK